MKKAIIALLIFIIIGGLAGGAYVFLMTDILKTPDQLFKKYLVTSIIDLTKMEMDPYGKVISRLSEESAQIKYASVDESQENKIELSYVSNPIDKKMKIDFGMNVEGNEYLSISAIIAEEIFGIQMKDVHEKYLALENRDLKKIVREFGTEETAQNIPDKIVFPEKMLQEDKDKMIAIITKYVGKINESIPAEKYIVEKQVAVSIGTENITTDKYSLIMDENEFLTLILNTMQELLADQEFLDLCKNRVDTQTIENLKQSINDSLIEVQKQTKQAQLKVSVYVADKITKKVEIISKEGTTEWFLKNTETESNFTIKNVANKTAKNKVASESIFKINNKITGSQGVLTIEEKTTYNPKDVKALEKNDSSLFDEDTKYEDSETKTIITSEFSDSNITGEIVLEGFENEKSDSDGEISAMKNTFEITFNQNLNIEELNEENTLILNDYTPEDFSNLGTELIMNALKTANEKPNSFIGSMAMLISFLAPTPEIDNSEMIDGDFVIEDDIIETNETEEITIVDERENVYNYVLSGLNKSLIEFKNELSLNEDANIGDFLTVENVQEECPENYALELLDGTTMKCIINGEECFYITMNINGETLLVDEINVYTEEEYLNM